MWKNQYSNPFLSHRWTFQNIPYAAPPVSRLRWEKPAPPLNHTIFIQGGNRKGAGCFQAPMDGMNIKEIKDPYKDHMDNMFVNPDPKISFPDFR